MHGKHGMIQRHLCPKKPSYQAISAKPWLAACLAACTALPLPLAIASNEPQARAQTSS